MSSVDRISLNQRGSVISELSLSLPLMLLLIVGIIDLGSLMQDYAMVEQAAREGVRSAGRLPGLEAVTHTSNSDTVTHSEATVCNAAPQSALCDHTLVHGRVRHILRNHNQLNIRLADLQVASTFDPLPATAPVTANDDSVTVQLTAPFRGFLLRYDITVSYRGPYLFQRVS